MCSINYQQLVTNAQSGDLLLFSDTEPTPLPSIYSLVVMIVRSPTYIDQVMQGLFVITSTSNQFEGLYGGKLVNIEHVLRYISELDGNLYYRELRCERDLVWEQLLTKSMAAVTYFPRSSLNEVEWISQQFYNRDVIYINYPDITQMTSHLIAYIYICVGLLPTGIPWTVLSPGDFSYDNGYQLPFTDCNLLPERLVDFNQI